MNRITRTAVGAFLAAGLSVSAFGFTALPIEKAANSSRTDAQADDGKGGWLDLGSNDLGVLPAGEASYAGVTFTVPPSGDESARNCIVLGRAGAETATLELDAPTKEARLFLLHAIAGGPEPETQKEIGKLVLRFDDGSVREHAVCVGVDVLSWTSGRSFANAVRAWTEYNRNTQVSLFVSRFPLESSKRLTRVEFAANGTCPWMIVAASVGKSVRLQSIRSCVEPVGTFRTPEPPPELKRFPAGRKPKNVILVIADGMGEAIARMGSLYSHGRADATYFQQLPVVGLCSTASADSPVTDSAAAATAFSTGTKTANGVLGLRVVTRKDRKNPVRLVSIAERARAKGLGVAILTTDPLDGATPAAFFAHTLSRGNRQDIYDAAAGCGFDVLIGSSATEPWLRPASQGGKREDERDLVDEMSRKGYSFVRTAKEIAAAPKANGILGALTTFDEEEGAGEAMAAVFGRLGDRSEGFFMMAESGNPDHTAHAGDATGSIKAISVVEFMAKAAIDFARPRGDTLVIVTADHDTGHPTVLKAAGQQGRLLVQWAEPGHTRFPVPLYAYGPGAERFEGPLDNTDIAKTIAQLLDLGE